MNKSPLYKLIQSLDKAEMREMKKFVYSPFFNSHPLVIALFDHLRIAISKEEDSTKEHAFALLYPEEPYDDLRLRHLMSQLLKCCREYLTWKELQNQPYQASILVCDAYRDKGLYHELDKMLKRQKRILETEKLNNAELHYYHYENLMRRVQLEGLRSSDTVMKMKSLSQDFDCYYFSEKLRLACLSMSMRNVLNTHLDLPFIEEILERVKRDELWETPAIGAYYFCFLMLSGDNETKAFSQLKSLLEEQKEAFYKKELLDLYSHLMNYCIRKINSDQPEFRQELLAIYKNSLQSGALTINNTISPWTYKNIAVLGLKLNEIQWVSEFIEDYKKYVSEELREGFHAYCKALMNFVGKQYNTVISSLFKMEIRDHFVTLDARVLEYKAWYEMAEYDQAEKVLKNLNQLVSRRGLKSYHDKRYKTFVSFAKELLNCVGNPSKQNEELLKSIQSAPTLTEKEWFLFKLSEL